MASKKKTETKPPPTRVCDNSPEVEDHYVVRLRVTPRRLAERGCPLCFGRGLRGGGMIAGYESRLCHCAEFNVQLAVISDLARQCHRTAAAGGAERLKSLSHVCNWLAIAAICVGLGVKALKFQSELTDHSFFFAGLMAMVGIALREGESAVWRSVEKNVEKRADGELDQKKES